ncbi:SNF1-interacting protein [Naganishia albida]|nr:SNF1-interacting protein [Naganishia albida]
MGNNQSHPPGSPRSGGNGSPNEGTGSSSRAANLSGIIFNRDRSGSSASFGSFGGGRNRDKDKGDAASTPQTPPGLIDGGHLHPQGTYAQRNPDYNHGIVKGLIIEKKLAPFYRGLEDYEEEWEDEDVIRSLRSLRAGQGQPALADLPPLTKVAEKERREARAYKGAAECPICFLYYPANINTTRCCEQPICTECFVQIKRAEATVTHLESEPAACPYCMEPDFGVIYEVQKIVRPDLPTMTHTDSGEVVDPRPNGETIRRKSVSSKAKEVVTIDQIRPDWEEKLNTVKAAAARRASRRIIMHRIGDRLIPVGYTSSRDGTNVAVGGDTGPIERTIDENALQAILAGADRGGSRSSRRSRRMGSGDSGSGMPAAADIEELMLMEAMRLSMLEHEEQQKKQAEEKKKEEEAARQKVGSISAATTSVEPVVDAGSSSSSSVPPPAPASQ